jgi:uncharacterized protein YrrD
MQRNINSLIGFRMQATDGEIGKVEEFYFDDQSWFIRYLILKTGDWLSGREALISPEALIKGAWKTHSFPVNLTKEQISNSPDINTAKPVSRQQEIELHGYYPWQPYWGSGFYAGGLWDLSNSAPVVDQESLREVDDRSDNDLHLRSTNEVKGYHIHATDGDIGHVSDFIIDDQIWGLEYLVVDTHNWLGGKKVLITVKHISKVQWADSKVYIDVNIDFIKNSEVFEAVKYMNPEVGSTV